MADSPALSMGHARALRRLSLAPSRLSNMAAPAVSSSSSSSSPAKFMGKKKMGATMEGDESTTLLMDVSLGDLQLAKKHSSSSPVKKARPSKRRKAERGPDEAFGGMDVEELERLAKEALEQEARLEKRRRRASKEEATELGAPAEASSSSPSTRQAKGRKSPRKTLLVDPRDGEMEEQYAVTTTAMTERETKTNRKSVAWAQSEREQTPPSAAVPMHSSPGKPRSILVSSPSKHQHPTFAAEVETREQRRYRLGLGPQAWRSSELPGPSKCQVPACETNETAPGVEVARDDVQAKVEARSPARKEAEVKQLSASPQRPTRPKREDSKATLASNHSPAAKKTQRTVAAKEEAPKTRARADVAVAHGPSRPVARAAEEAVEPKETAISAAPKPQTRRQLAVQEASQAAVAATRSTRTKAKPPATVTTAVPEGFRLSSTGQLVAISKPKEFSFAKSSSRSTHAAREETKQGGTAGPKANPVPEWLKRRREALKKEEAARLEAELERVRIEELHRGQAPQPSQSRLRVQQGAKEDVNGPATTVAPGAFVSSVEARLAERAAWEERRREKEEALERQREAARLERQKRDDEEYREARKRSVPKANPVPAWLHQRR